MVISKKEILTVPEFVRETIYERMKVAREKIGSAVRPIYGAKKGKFEHIGSCIFLKRASQHLLMTAAHVIDEAKSYQLRVGVGTKLVSLDGLNGAMSTPPQGNRDYDKYDFAVLPLPANFVEALGQSRYLDESDFSSHSIDSIGRAYMAFGYPNSRNRKIRHDTRTVKSEALSYGATAIRDTVLASKLAITGEDHLFIAYNEFCRDENDAIVNSVKPRGMSGGALIDLGKIGVADITSPMPDFGLAGLLIEIHKADKRIVAVKIDTILGALDRSAKMPPK